MILYGFAMELIRCNNFFPEWSSYYRRKLIEISYQYHNGKSAKNGDIII